MAQPGDRHWHFEREPDRERESLREREIERDFIRKQSITGSWERPGDSTSPYVVGTDPEL